VAGQHLAALKASNGLLVLELMHFASEITPASEVKAPEAKLGAREKGTAKLLIDQMSGEWEPEDYTDEYADAVMKLIEKKVAAGGKEILGGAKRHAPAATNVVDLVAVLQQSLGQSSKGPRAPKRQPPKRRATAQKAARGIDIPRQWKLPRMHLEGEFFAGRGQWEATVVAVVRNHWAQAVCLIVFDAPKN
jgi:DNA end-binding protein Ku